MSPKLTHKTCCVPNCFERSNLHRVPYTSGLRWQRWLKMCPFLQKFCLDVNTMRLLENQRICRRHFIPEHIDYEKGRLGKDAIPLLHLPIVKPNEQSKNILEIGPINPNKPVNFKIVTFTSSSHTETENFCKSPFTKGMKLEVCLKAEDMHRLPVDHNMYCLPSPEDKPLAYMSSPCDMFESCLTPSEELLSNYHTGLNIEAGPDPGAIDHGMSFSTFLPGNTVAEAVAGIDDKLSMKEVVTLGTASRGTVSVASQTDEDMGHLPIELSEQLPDFMAAANKHSLNDNLVTGTVECLLDSPSATLDNCDCDDIEIQSNVYVGPTGTVADGSVQAVCREQSGSVNKVMFSSLKEKCKQPFNHISTKPLQENKFTHISTKPLQENKFTHATPSATNYKQSQINFQPLASVPQPLPQPSHEPTLESLVAELIESVNAEEAEELCSSLVDTQACLLNPNSDSTNCNPMHKQGPPVITIHPLTSMVKSKPKRFRYVKENSSEKEEILYKELKILRGKLQVANTKNRVLKNKIKKLKQTTKPYLRSYPRLTPEAKALIDAQLRLAGVKSRAARYNDEEKLFALRVHQISPDCYSFLQQYLKLPARSTMQEFIKHA